MFYLKLENATTRIRLKNRLNVLLHAVWGFSTHFQTTNSNINEVIRVVYLFIFFFTIRFHKHKTAYSKQKLKNTHKKHLREKKVTYSLICVLCFYTFSAFSKNKEFKRSEETSFYVFTSPTKLDFICIVLV